MPQVWSAVPLACAVLGAVAGWAFAVAAALLLPAALMLLSRRARTGPDPETPRAALLAALSAGLDRDGLDRGGRGGAGRGAAGRGGAGRVGAESAGTADGHPDQPPGTICLILHADDLAQATAQAGPGAAPAAMAELQRRLAAALRQADTVVRLEDAVFALAIVPDGRCDLEALLQIAARLQRTASDPIPIAAARVRLRISVGLCCTDSLRHPTAADAVEGAETALMEARAAGPGSIRVFAPAMQTRRAAREALMQDAIRALENGEIEAWFQPQLSTDTGRVSGVETLARWDHPQRGPVPPGDFLPALEAAGLTERLTEQMIDRSLRALVAWDRAGLDVPCAGVNLSPGDLQNPRLAERIAWQIDRFDLDPGRLAIEVLETVVVDTPGGTIARNIDALTAMGCHVDLDDFGTGHTSITTLRRLKIARLKIDRSFVAGVDTDRDQQRMVNTVLAMCEHLGLDTLAEGVETAAEHAMLAQLGCRHVQGFAIARPMPFDQTAAWLRSHAAAQDTGAARRGRPG